MVSLTNIGDVILTFPVIDIIRNDFPSAKLFVVIGPKAETLLKGNPYLEKCYIFDKHQSALKSLSWIKALRQEHFDLVKTTISLHKFNCSRRNKNSNLRLRERLPQGLNRGRR